MNDTSKMIAAKIASILEERNWGQKDFALMMGKSEPEISKWLRGNHNFTLKTIESIEWTLNATLLEVNFISSNTLVSCRYSVSLVYEKHQFNGSGISTHTALQVFITSATSDEEALGKAIKYFEKEMTGYGIKNKVVIKIQNYGS